MSPVIDALDRLDHVAACLEAIADLLMPETDLHAVDRNKQALLLAFLAMEHQLARDQLAKALQSGKVANIR